jgi:6-phosphogluconolactonase
MFLHIEKNRAELHEKMAAWICEYVTTALLGQERFTWVLSGGETPKQLYRLLATSPWKEKIPWNKIHFFFGDERYVPFDNEENNGKMACECLLKQVSIPAEQIHYIDTTFTPDESAEAYKKILEDYFPEGSKSFDLVLLGMGDDGHTLSVFPDSELISEQSGSVKAFYVAEKKMHRITLLPKIVNHAARVAFLVEGEKKAGTLAAVLYGTYNPEKFPAQLIKPSHGELHWFIDEAAAARL